MKAPDMNMSYCLPTQCQQTDTSSFVSSLFPFNENIERKLVFCNSFCNSSTKLNYLIGANSSTAYMYDGEYDPHIYCTFSISTIINITLLILITK